MTAHFVALHWNASAYFHVYLNLRNVFWNIVFRHWVCSVCVCVCIYLYIYIYIYTHTQIKIFIYIYIYTHIYTDTDTYKHSLPPYLKRFLKAILSQDWLSRPGTRIVDQYIKRHLHLYEIRHKAAHSKQNIRFLSPADKIMHSSLICVIVYVCVDDVCVYVWIHVCMHLCSYECMYVCMYLRMYACMRVFVYACTVHVCMRVCMLECTHVCVYACMRVCM
jgi:hypothetical protein